MKLADEAGALAAMRHARNQVVTVAIDQMSFHEPIRLDDLVMLEAEVTYVGRSSMETRVRVLAENPISGEQMHTNTAYIVYVALDDEGKPCTVPGLIAETEAAARGAAEAVDADYRVLEGVFSPREALAPGAPILHPPRPGDEPSNVMYGTHVEAGDVEAALVEADVVVEVGPQPQAAQGQVFERQQQLRLALQ